MMTQYVDMIVAVLTVLTGGGGVAVFMQRRHNRKMRALEAQLADANVEKARIEAKADEWNIWKEQLEAEREHVRFKDQLLREKEERFNDQTQHLRSVQRDLLAANRREIDYIKENARLTIERDHYFNWRCFREDDDHDEGCRRRKPRQPAPIRYIPLSHDEIRPGLASVPARTDTPPANPPE